MQAHLKTRKLSQLTATPSSHDTHVPSPLFKVAWQRRLRLPVWDQDSACGLSGEILDRWGDHALCCGGGGDRVLRHNAIRNTVCSAVAEFTSVSLELEKPGLLLPPRPPAPTRSSTALTAILPPAVGAAPQTCGFFGVVYLRLAPSSDEHHLLHSCLGTGLRFGTHKQV